MAAKKTPAHSNQPQKKKPESKDKNKQEAVSSSKIGSSKPVEILRRPIDGEPVTLFRPVIDKISVCFNSPDPDQDHDLVQIIGESPTLFENGEVVVASKAAFKGPRYEWNREIRIGENGANALLQAGPKQASQKSVCRLEFNPAAIGPGGVARLDEILSEIVFGEFGFSHVALTGRVTWLDIAVDVVGIEIGRTVARLRNSSTKSVEFKSASGETETTYLKYKPKGGSPIRAYDKRKQLRETKKSPMFGKQPHIRVEARANLKRTIHELDSIKNPLADIQLVAMRSARFPEKEHHWLMFLEFVRNRGIADAIEVLPERLKEKYRYQFEISQAELLLGNSLWSHWPDVLEESGLLLS